MSKFKGGQKLIQAHRTLILEDVIVIKNTEPTKKKSLLGKDQVKLQIWLFNDVLVHLKTSKSKSKTNVASAKYTWPLQLVWLKDEKDDPSEPKLPCSFTLVGPLKNYNLRFADNMNKQKWYAGIKDAVQKVLTPEIAPDEQTRFGAYEFPNEKGKYEGWWTFGRIHGQGQFTFFGNKYFGDWEYNVKSGRGKLELVSGEVFEGHWADDKPHGWGLISYGDDTAYVGDWVQGVREGRGRMAFSRGECYDGYWKNNAPWGQGIYTSPTGFNYVGQWQNGRMHGPGRLVAPNGRSYEGDFDMGAKDGEGRMDYGNGDWYIGQWKADKRHGFGIYYSRTEGTYEGFWANDCKDGYGKQRYSTGNIYDGNWKRGTYHGRGTFVACHGGMQSYDGQWENGKLNGKGVVVYSTGGRFDGQFKDDQQHGIGVQTSINSVNFEGKWSEGQKEGRCTIAIGPSKHTSTIKGNVMEEGERSFLVSPDLPLFYCDL